MFSLLHLLQISFQLVLRLDSIYQSLCIISPHRNSYYLVLSVVDLVSLRRDVPRCNNLCWMAKSKSLLKIARNFLKNFSKLVYELWRSLAKCMCCSSKAAAADFAWTCHFYQVFSLLFCCDSEHFDDLILLFFFFFF